MNKITKLITCFAVVLVLSGCSGTGGGFFEKRSDEGYKKSPCACFDEFIIMNGKIYEVEKS